VVQTQPPGAVGAWSDCPPSSSQQGRTAARVKLSIAQRALQADQAASTSTVTITFKRCTPPDYATAPKLQPKLETACNLGRPCISTVANELIEHLWPLCHLRFHQPGWLGHRSMMVTVSRAAWVGYRI
jgi:hypothetical protein